MKATATLRAISIVIATLVAAASLVGIAAFTTAQPAAATGFEANGCGPTPNDIVPDLWFRQDCNGHDYCYYQKPHGATWQGRKTCDDIWLDAMYNTCNRTFPAWWQSPARWGCSALAAGYYAAVRAFGGFFWNP